MAKHPKSRTGSSGRLSYRPAPDEGPIPKTLEFVRNQLHAWRDDPKRPSDSSERRLNSSLCIFLNSSRSRSECPMVCFSNDPPQTGIHTVDIGAHDIEENSGIGVSIRPISIYEPFMVIECKRLPAPNPKSREREYVTGKHQKSGGPAGGIQRFKLGLHGAKIETAVIIGYIQKLSVQHWFATINQWITDLVADTSSDGCVWSHTEVLESLECDNVQATATARSMHRRTDGSVTPSIRIHHLWVVM